MNLSYNISYSVAGLSLLIFLLVIISINYSQTSAIKSRFKYFLIASLVMIILDIATVITIDYYKEVPISLNIILNSLYFLSGTSTSILFFYYIMSIAFLSHSKKKRILYIINLSLYAIFFISLIVNVFTKMYFSFNETEGYVKGPIYLGLHVVTILFLIESAIILLVRRRSFTRRQRISIIFFFAVFSISFVLQLTAFKDILLSDFGSAIGAVIVFYSIETPDYIKLTKTLKELNDLKESLENQVKERTKDLDNERKILFELTLETLTTLANVIDAKDHYTNGHSYRVAAYAKGMAEEYGLSMSEIRQIYFAGLMHDVGKIGISDAILTKPGKLTPEEYEIIKSHAAIGGDILKGMKHFKTFEIVARNHHERYDGKGYPDHLAKDDIPLEARIVQICDTFDAMTTDRSYRKALPDEVALEELKKGKGTQFDPVLVDVFLSLYNRYQDSIKNHVSELTLTFNEFIE